MLIMQSKSVGTNLKTKILVLGVSGMLGNAIFRVFSQDTQKFTLSGMARSDRVKSHLPQELQQNIVWGIDVENIDALTQLLASTTPDIVINCIGLVKQLKESNDSFSSISINALFPHRLARLCKLVDARLIHISTDCVFNGSRGMYSESDNPDAQDLYGRSKLLGEVDYSNAITLRTSIIGHEMQSAHSLVEWFLSQTDTVKGYKRALFSGLPTVELATVIRDYVIPRPELRGVYHVSASPINKFDLLSLIAEIYKKSIVIEPDENLVIDRSLDSNRFRSLTGYKPPPWAELVRRQYAFHLNFP